MPTQQPLVLMTGSSGYLGAPLVERLLSDYRVVGLDQKPPEREPRGAGADFVRCESGRSITSV
jgi:nucleoside-diphosphate-sugar epimerase